MLDSALLDFGKTKRKEEDDDDLDDYMATMDREAAQKAAANFQNMLDQMARATQLSNQEEEAKLSAAASSSSSTKQEGFMEAINKLMQQSGDVMNSGDEESLMKALDALGSGDNAMGDELMEMIVSATLSREIMYPAIKEMYDKFGPFLAENEGKIDSAEYERYVEQQKVLKRLCEEYEQEDAEGNQSKSTEKRAQRLTTHWIELQKLGLPPQEVAGALHEGWDVDAESGLPKLAGNNPDGGDAEGCSIM